MQKFIVTADGRLRYGDVTFHKDLLKPGESCIGGGVFEFDFIGHRMLLSGRSYDFGRVKWSWVDKLVLPAGLAGMEILYEDLPLDSFADIVYE